MTFPEKTSDCHSLRLLLLLAAWNDNRLGVIGNLRIELRPWRHTCGHRPAHLLSRQYITHKAAHHGFYALFLVTRRRPENVTQACMDEAGITHLQIGFSALGRSEEH